MSIVVILFIAVGLAMDSFAVSAVNGIYIRKSRVSYAFKNAACFGGVQAFMSLAGWVLGTRLETLITSTDHWIAFGLLLVIGMKMVYESTKNTHNDKEPVLNNRLLFIQAIATSIDALVVGISFAFLKFSIFVSILIIGSVTFTLSFAGVLAGGRFNFVLKDKAGIAGGLILIGIGIKILLEHLF